jgi:polysaccharide export outer membrane protein
VIRFTSLVLAFCLIGQGTCAAAQSGSNSDAAPKSIAVSEAPVPVHTTPQPDDVIGPNDSVTIVALESEELSKTWRVTSGGDLELPMVGKTHVEGLTAEKLQNQLGQELKKYIHDPHVTVFIAEFRSQPVTVTGAVHRPGTFQTEGSKTLWTVLSMAGGLEHAPGATVTITRQIRYGEVPLPGAHSDSTGTYSVATILVKDVMDTSSPASKLLIQPNDVVDVSSEERMVYIIGEVIKPGAVELVTHDRISMVQLLAAAQGLSKLSNARNSQIMRVNSQGLYEKVGTVDLKKLISGKIEDRLLNAGDIVVVPSSTLKVYTAMMATSAISTGMYTILQRF